MKAINNSCNHGNVKLGSIVKICIICDPVLECFHCGATIKNVEIGYPEKWGLVEFTDGWVPMCPDCKKKFPPKIDEVEYGYYSLTIVAHMQGYKRTKWYKALHLKEEHGKV
jgi:hypothetical protein